MMRGRLRSSVFFYVILMLLLSACGGGEVPASVCGDGVCSGDEGAQSCAADCEIATEVPASPTPQPTPTEEIDPLGYLTFAIYVSDFVNHRQSAETVLALIDLFEENGVQGEFYLTGPITSVFVEEQAEVIDRLRATGMTISYHAKPPHPLMRGFQGPISSLPVDQTKQMVTRYESEELDLQTGGLNPDKPGGYTYLMELFGTPPVAVDAPHSSRSGFAIPILARMGAKVVVYPDDTDPQQPFRYRYEMLERPADITINRWQVEGVDDVRNWWDMLASEFASRFLPLERLQTRVEAWDAGRLPIILVPINEYNFYREGPAPWTLIYYQDASRSKANHPPFDLNASDPSTARSEENRLKIWESYAAMVEWGSVYMDSVTSADIVKIATGAE